MEFSRKSVFGNPAILAACKRYEAGNACFRWTRSGISRSWKVYRRRREIMFRRGCEARRKYFSAWPLGGPSARGGLEPHFRVLFSAIFHAFPLGVSIRVETCGSERKQKCGLLWRLYIQSFYVFWSPSAFPRGCEESQYSAVLSQGIINCGFGASRPGVAQTLVAHLRRSIPRALVAGLGRLKYDREG